MNEHTTPLIHQQPSPESDEHQTVIKFVLSGPILTGQPEVAHVPSAQSEEIAELRERLSVLERALAEADSRFEAMQQALAATVAAAAANAVGAASAPARSTAPPRATPPPAVEVEPEPSVAAESEREPEPVYDFTPAATFDRTVDPLPIAPFAPPAPEPGSYLTAAPVEPPPLAAAVMPDPFALSLVTEPAAPVPALRAPDPGPPKIRGLRRMISVLKNL